MKINDNRPIGVFDSGMGGLTVLKELQAILPHENFIYVADSLNLPYGDKTEDQIIQFTQRIMDWFKQQDVKMVVLACHTSSAIAHASLIQNAAFPILCSITPIAEHFKNQSRHIGIMATQRTTQSKVFEKYFLSHNNDHKLISLACPEFVPLIEAQQIDTIESSLIVQRYLNEFLDRNIETLIFGCTHYPYLKKMLKKLLPENSFLTFEDPGFYLALKTSETLEELNLKNNGLNGATKFYSTHAPDIFAEKIKFALDIKTSVNLVKA
ncbi:MAG: glutamate racemase [Alphaproteobacteria bacterium]|nr:glutamate racemase [Alphaproteobacteria bacterium]